MCAPNDISAKREVFEKQVINMNQKKNVKFGCALLAGALLFGSVAMTSVTPMVVFATEAEAAGGTDASVSTDPAANTGETTGAEQGGTTDTPSPEEDPNATVDGTVKAQQEAATVIEAINAIGEVTENSGTAITNARNLFNALSPEAQALVSNYSLLTAAEEKYKTIVDEADKKEQEEEAAVNQVIDAIKAIGEVTSNSGEAISRARSLYDALSDSAREKVNSTEYAWTLVCAENTFKNLSSVVSVEDDDDDISYAKEGNVTLMGTDASYIFIGDSRTVGMAQYVNTNQHIWSAKVGAGLSWMKSDGVPAVEGKITSGSNVVILMGVNDCGNTSNEKKYASYINEKAKSWVAKGANVYYVSVNPITRDSVANGSITNAKIEAWNSAIQADLTDDVTYIDTYTKLKGELVATDGLHYTKRGCQLIYNAILEFVEADSVEAVNEDEVAKLAEFQTKISSVQRDSEEGTVTISVTAPEDINNVTYQVEVYNETASDWEVVTESKMTTISFGVDEGEVKIRARATKKYETEIAEGKWSNVVTVDAEGSATGVEEEKSGGVLGKIMIGLLIAVFVFFAGYFVLRKKEIIGATPIDQVYNGVANLFAKKKKRSHKKN